MHVRMRGIAVQCQQRACAQGKGQRHPGRCKTQKSLRRIRRRFGVLETEHGAVVGAPSPPLPRPLALPSPSPSPSRLSSRRIAPFQRLARPGPGDQGAALGGVGGQHAAATGYLRRKVHQADTVPAVLYRLRPRDVGDMGGRGSAVGGNQEAAQRGDRTPLPVRVRRVRRVFGGVSTSTRGAGP